MKITASNNSELAWRYAPIAIGNGDISILIDYEGNTNHAVYCHGRTPTGIWRAGIRYDNIPLNLVSFGGFYQTLDNTVELKEWEQTLDVTGAATDSVCRYENGIVVHTQTVCHLEKNLVIISKRVENCDKFSMTYKFAPKRTTCTPVSETKTEYRIDSHKEFRDSFSFFSKDECVKAARNGDEITLNAKSSSAVFYLAFDEEAEKYAMQYDYEEIMRTHQEAWAKFWAESTVPVDNVPQKVLEAARVSEYHLRISSTQWSVPMGIYPTHWESKYFAFDELFIILGFLASGHYDLAKKIVSFRKSFLNAAKSRVYGYFGNSINSARYTWESIEIPGLEATGGGLWCDHIFQMANVGLGAWHCWLYKHDMDFLKETAYPVMKACAEFYREFMVCKTNDGKTIIWKCTDLERLGPARENAYMTTCGCISLFKAAAEAAGILGEDEELKEMWTTLAGELGGHLPQNENSYLPYPGCEDKSIAMFSGLFPYEVIPADNKKQLAAIKGFCDSEDKYGNMCPYGKSLCTWYGGWKAITFSRLGQLEAARETLNLMADHTGMFREVFEILEPGVIAVKPWFTTAEGSLLQAVCEVYKNE